MAAGGARFCSTMVESSCIIIARLVHREISCWGREYPVSGVTPERIRTKPNCCLWAGIFISHRIIICCCCFLFFIRFCLFKNGGKLPTSFEIILCSILSIPIHPPEAGLTSAQCGWCGNSGRLFARSKGSAFLPELLCFASEGKIKGSLQGKSPKAKSFPSFLHSYCSLANVPHTPWKAPVLLRKWHLVATLFTLSLFGHVFSQPLQKKSKQNKKTRVQTD